MRCAVAVTICHMSSPSSDCGISTAAFSIVRRKLAIDSRLLMDRVLTEFSKGVSLLPIRTHVYAEASNMGRSPKSANIFILTLDARNPRTPLPYFALRYLLEVI